MAIGTVRFQGQRAGYQTGRADVGQSIAGVGTALLGLEESQQELQMQRDQLAQKNADFNAQRTWAQLQGELTREITQMSSSLGPDPSGFTTAAEELMQPRIQEFLGSLSESTRQTYLGKTEVYKQNRLTEAFSSELELRNIYERDQINDTLTDLQNNIALGKTSYEQASQDMLELIGSTTLRGLEQENLAQQTEQLLLGAEYLRELNLASGLNIPSQPTDGSTAVAPGLSGSQIGLLDAIASVESGGKYNVRYTPSGGEEFELTGEHPRLYEEGPHGPSSAAGRYQIVWSTWSKFAKGRDFSEVNQDRIALEIAEASFNAQLKPGEMQFSDILENGNREQLIAMREMLASTWVGLDNYDALSNDDFVEMILGMRETNGNGLPGVPQAMTDAKYAALDYATKVTLMQQSAATTKSMQAGADAQYQSFIDTFIASATLGQVDTQDYVEAVENQLIRAEDIPRVQALFEEALAQNKAANSFGESVANGTTLGNTKDNQSAANTFYEMSGITAGIEAMDTEAQQALTRSFTRTGVISEEMASTLEAMANSTDRNQQLYALNTLGMMRNQNTQGFIAAVPKTVFQKTNEWNVLSSLYGPQQAQELLAQSLSPENAATRAARDKDSVKLLEDMDIGAKIDEVADTLGFNATLTNTQNQLLFSGQFDSLFRTAYRLTGDEDAAKKIVMGQMQRSWAPETVGNSPRSGIISFGGKELVNNGPSALGSGYIGKDFQNVEQLRFAILKEAGLSWDDAFSIVTDSQTQGEINRGEAGSFMIYRQREDGTFSPVMDEVGNIYRFRPEASEDLQNMIQAEKALDLALAKTNEALYFSNQMLPFSRDFDPDTAAEAEEALANIASNNEELFSTLDNYTARYLYGKYKYELETTQAGILETVTGERRGLIAALAELEEMLDIPLEDRIYKGESD